MARGLALLATMAAMGTTDALEVHAATQWVRAPVRTFVGGAGATSAASGVVEGVALLAEGEARGGMAAWPFRGNLCDEAEQRCVLVRLFAVLLYTAAVATHRDRAHATVARHHHRARVGAVGRIGAQPTTPRPPALPTPARTGRRRRSGCRTRSCFK